MSSLNEDRPRQVVPRLRKFEVAAGTAEVSSFDPKKENPFTEEMLKNNLADWLHNPSLFVAADLVSVAAALGRMTIAKDAARFVLDSPNAPKAARSLAAIYLGEEHAPLSREMRAVQADRGVFLARDLWQEIHDTRLQLNRYPNNPLLWANLAYLYTSIGLEPQALRATRVALGLAPDNRFIVRSASRVYLHQHDGERAHAILARSNAVKSDPWILSAEIATAAAIDCVSEHIKHAQKLLDADKFSPMHLSELASAVGTLEAMRGNAKWARKILRRSLEQPTENAVAQAAWLSRNAIGAVVLDLSPKMQTRSYEANAWINMKGAKWDETVNQARRWQNDQPFSSRPAIFGSFIAARVNDKQEEALAFADQGLRTNPDDFMLRNNRAFSLAQLNRTDEADQELKRINRGEFDSANRIYVAATSGLIAFRQGRVRDGRQLYGIAEEGSKTMGDSRLHAIASIYHALEELRAQTTAAEKYRAAAITAASALKNAEDLLLSEQLKEFKPAPSPLAGVFNG